MNSTDKEGMREVARELRPDWSDEQFDAHWDAFARLKIAVARGRRKQAQKRSRANSPSMDALSHKRDELKEEEAELAAELKRRNLEPDEQ